MPRKKATKQKASTKRKSKKKAKRKVKVENLPDDAELSEQDLEGVRGALGFTNYATYWGNTNLLQKPQSQDPLKYPTCPDGIVKE